MDTELMLDVGQANELKFAFRRSGWTNADIKKFSEGDFTKQMLSVIKGLTKIVEVKHVVHIINCDADPFLPEGWSVDIHKKQGNFEWDPTKIKLHLSPEQKRNRWINGYELREELANEPVLNANTLDYLLTYQELIPEEWKSESVFFWGTIYHDSNGCLYVRYLHWSEHCKCWTHSWNWLRCECFHNFPAACLQTS